MTNAVRAKFESEMPAGDFQRCLRTPEGIAGWWSDTVTGDAGVSGDVFHVSFPTSPVVFDLRVSEADDSTIEWTIDENPPWWKGTTIRFELTDTDGGSELMFTHDGFADDDPIIPVITPAWVRFLDNLVAVTRSGVPDPAVRN
ncbi:MAG: SRPBCC domain-containing protein [Acidimicrobiia bacterium]|nr:SRPBCC domain-containing protein [Acidimicrobiia bacterium]MDH4308533.1 SRPBCC domain-containing protein [Acidimicrobiia bacterium]MDH5292361.1 SRPBCC domain-containing protein [Acidimicrobiia bacterium]